MFNQATNLFGILNLAGLAYAQAAGVEVSNNYWVDIVVDPEEPDYAKFTLMMPINRGWFGIGFGYSMKVGNDIIMVDGSNGDVFDMVSIGNGVPEQDNTQNIID